MRDNENNDRDSLDTIEREEDIASAVAFDGKILKACARKWRKALSDSACGPLVVAPEVVAVIDDWDAYKDEVGGVPVAAWLRTVFGSRGVGPRFWRQRANAVDELGEAIRRTLHHEVAIWVMSAVPTEQHTRVKRMLMREAKKQHGVPLSPHQARKRVYEMLGWKPKSKTKECKQCMKLEALLRQHGIDFE